MTVQGESALRAPLSRDRVLREAIRLADELGLESLSMRRLGRALGVEAMSLYNHVANRDAILDGIVDLVLAEFEMPSNAEDWQAGIRSGAISAHEALLRHPWACSLVMARFRPGRMRYMDWLLGRLREAGFTAETTYYAYHVLDSHILGFTLWQLGHSIDSEEVEDAAATFMREAVNQYPHLAEHIEQHLAEAGPKGSAFEFGLDLLLDGLRRGPLSPAPT